MIHVLSNGRFRYIATASKKRGQWQTNRVEVSSTSGKLDHGAINDETTIVAKITNHANAGPKHYEGGRCWLLLTINTAPLGGKGPSMTWTVRVIEEGRSGYIEYIENGHTCQCYGEFGGGDTIAIISVPSATEWESKYSWAKNRRLEILNRLADETRKQRAPAADIEWDAHRNYIYLRERRGA
jgi:hypothetical protein